MKEGIYRIHTGYDYPGPHQGNFCSNGVIPPTREESAKLKEVKAAHQFVDITIPEVNYEFAIATIQIKNKYNFTNLKEFDIVYDVVKNGKVVYTGRTQAPSAAPGKSAKIWITIKKATNISKLLKRGDEVMLTIRLVHREAQMFAPAGHEVAMQQFEITPRGALAAIKSKGAPLASTSSLHEYVIGNENVQVKFDANTAQLTALAFNGKNVIADNFGFIYDNHRWIENDRFNNTNNGLEANGNISVVEENGNTVVKTLRKGSLCDTEIDYTIYPQGIIDVEAKFIPKSGDLRRAGLVCGIDSALNKVNYYALGPWENTVDRKDGVVVGRYSTTVDNMAAPYVKPQSSGSREGLREVTFTDNNGEGIKIETEGNVSFSALPYTDEDLMNANHYWDMEKRPYTVLHLDAWMRGIGNASCGYDVGTMPEYCVPNKEMTYKLRISPVKK